MLCLRGQVLGSMHLLFVFCADICTLPNTLVALTNIVYFFIFAELVLNLLLIICSSHNLFLF